MEDTLFKKLPEALLAWFSTHKRDLPWRQDRDPYHIWLSEIMLQQTRVEAVKGYYSRFLSTLPTIEALANADDELLHKLWEGLGYYSRVRNLKKAAKVIVSEYGGRFPEDYSQVLSLPGIGEYTAGAICSIAFDRPTPAVDGNVLRLIARLTDDGTAIDSPAFKKRVRAALEQIYPKQAGDFTQALMELGATVCGPNRAPDCENCPCRDFCMGCRNGTAARLPVKTPKKKRRVEAMTVLILTCDGSYGLRKRPDSGLLASLWEFPHVEGHLDTAAAIGVVEEMGLNPKNIIRSVERKHIFTHIEWQMRGYYVEVGDCGGSITWFPEEQLRRKAALPTAFRQFLPEDTFENSQK